MDLRGRKLTRSLDDRKLSGVCGGIGEYFQLDPVLIRLAWVFGTAMTGVVPGILAYLVAWLIVPEAPRVIYAEPVQPTVNES
ncbi:MAG: PspC domain-containing protein [Acidobacteria bacterium]|uniref:PspC domain-containing protein n=1 Tax=Candidatus Polarisedimenticola svalbardensis TaxID=2886004 RepID=A0A8J6XRM5_9BACT|nr:PspC domain-containing protein [Candidatus Polarisedimenticola svalbardensis]